MPTPNPVVRVAVATFAGAVGGLAAFGGGWLLLAGSAPPLVGWLVGGVITAFIGSEVGCRAASACSADEPSAAEPPPQAPLTPAPFDEPPHPESRWRDRVRSDAPPLLGPRR